MPTLGRQQEGGFRKVIVSVLVGIATPVLALYAIGAWIYHLETIRYEKENQIEADENR